MGRKLCKNCFRPQTPGARGCMMGCSYGFFDPGKITGPELGRLKRAAGDREAESRANDAERARKYGGG